MTASDRRPITARTGPAPGECPDCGAPDGRWCRPWCPWFKGGES